MTDRSDPVVILAAGQSGNAVFFSIHAHASEFQNVKFLAVFGQALLPVEGSSAVPADQDRDHDHQRGQYDQGNAGNQDVKSPLDDQILRSGVIALQHQDRQMEHVNGVGALHEQVAHTGNDISADICLHAVFDDLISVMAVNAAEENRLCLTERLLQIIHDIRDMVCLNDIKPLVQAIGIDKVFQSLAHIIDDHCPDRLKFAEILRVSNC